MLVIRALFWGWFLVSAVVLLFRLARRLQGRKKRRMATSGLGAATTPAATATADEASPPTSFERSDPERRAPEPTAPEPRAAEPATDEPTVAEPLVTPVVSNPRAAEPADDSARPSAPASRIAPLSGPPTIAEMVAGIQMPCDLVPYLAAESRPGAVESVAFLTTSYPAEAVGESTATELERLGFRVHPLAHDQVLATRGDDELKLAVHPRPSVVAYGGQPAFPLAPTGSVILEMWRD